MHAAVQSLAWRGPDGQGLVRAGTWWLGCARLAITQANSTQPVVRRGGRFAGVMNGAITNARELWAQLLPGAERRRAPPNDAWLPLLAVARGDVALLANLRGHHAYAVVDAAADTLVVGQDRFGEKPLFALIDRWAGQPTLVAFASTPAALRLLGMPVRVSPPRAAEWFRFGWSMPRAERFTSRLRLQSLPLRGVPLLAAALAGGSPLQPALASAATSATATAPLRREPKHLRDRLVAAVERCLDTTVPAGLALSGGFDSSCLAAAIAMGDVTVPAWHLRAAGTSVLEREAARAMAHDAGLDLRPVDVGPEVLDALPQLTAFAGQPLGDPSLLAVHAVARAAANDGIRILLSGEGADELFLGYRRYRALAHLPRWPWLRSLLPRWSMGYPARWLRAAAAADPITALLAVTPPAFAAAVLAEDLARRRCWREDQAPMPRRPDGDPVLVARQFDLDHYLRCDLLPKVDIATMAAGVEARCPFLDGDFAEFTTDRSGLGKSRLRAEFAPYLPPEVLRLPKHGFALPLDRWFRGELPWLDLLRDATTCQRPHLRPGGLADAIDRHRSGRADLGHGLYLLVAYELFLRAIGPGNTNSVPTSPGLPA